MRIRWTRCSRRFGDALAVLAFCMHLAGAGGWEIAFDPVESLGTRPHGVGEISEMVPTLSEIWCEEWKAEGRQEGREEGLQQGRTEAARDLVLRLLRRRFADIPNVVESRVSAASLDELMVWTERILDADSLDSVFETPR